MQRLLISLFLPLAILLVAIQGVPQAEPCVPGGPCQYLPLIINPIHQSPTVTATLSPTMTPTLPPAEFVNCSTVPSNTNALNYPVEIEAIDKLAELVTLRNVSTSAVDLTDWRMCSIEGGQQHPISGILEPGQARIFPGPAGSIWNNTSPDPGALWNPSGQLVSYRSS